MISCSFKKEKIECLFEELAIGDTFLYQDKYLCIKVWTSGDSFALSLTSGTRIGEIANKSTVTPVDCELTYKFRKER